MTFTDTCNEIQTKFYLKLHQKVLTIAFLKSFIWTQELEIISQLSFKMKEVFKFVIIDSPLEQLFKLKTTNLKPFWKPKSFDWPIIAIDFISTQQLTILYAIKITKNFKINILTLETFESEWQNNRNSVK